MNITLIIVIIVAVLIVGSRFLKKNDTSTDTLSKTQTFNDGTFSMVIDDVFTITGRGTVVTGHIDKGSIRLNDVVKVAGLTTTVTGIEMFRKHLDYAEEGDNVGLLLKDVGRNDVQKGQIITK
jgi:translation elongation factor EF-Tu-like GTPase